jgi:DUF4097 and DUF4098 domain-containing protein YvlB
MKKPGISALILLAAAALATPAFAQNETERVDRTVQIRAGGQLRLNNFSGHVKITGTGRADVAIHAVRRAPRERLDHVKLEITETSGGVQVEANKKDDYWRDREKSDVVDTDFDIEVPADVNLDINVFSSKVEVRDVRGRQRVHTFSGDVDLGEVWGSIDADTFSGDIAVKLVNAAGGHIDFDSFSGDLRSDLPITYHGGSRRRVTGDLGSGTNDYHFKTFSGRVKIQ